MNKSEIFIAFIKFLMKRKKYWLIPIVIVLVLLGVIVVFTENSVISPFVYSLF
ncbi:DUF5989 family protein [Aquimarina rhabdastrellae]